MGREARCVVRYAGKIGFGDSIADSKDGLSVSPARAGS